MGLPQSITVQGRRWFQRTYGNTYHTVRVLVDGREVFQSEKQYGYGEQYLQTACEWLECVGTVPPKSWPLTLFCLDNGIAFDYSVTDVGRERDL